MNLVEPLIDSLRHTMLVKSNALQMQLQSSAISFREAVAASMDSRGFPPEPTKKARRADRPFDRRAERSVQRMHLPAGKDARWVVDEYVRWLPGPGSCAAVESSVRFYLRLLSVPLLNLSEKGRRITPC